MVYQEFKEAVLAAAAAAGLKDYEIYYATSAELSVAAYQQEINEYQTSTSGGACFRCIVNGKMGYAATECFDEEQVTALVERAMENAASIESEDEVFIHEAGDVYQAVTKVVSEIPSADKMTAIALDCQKKVYEQDSRVIDGTQSGTVAVKGMICLANSKGLDLSQEYGMHAVMAAPIVKEEGSDEMYMGYKVTVGELDQIDVAEVAAKGVEDAVSLMNPDKVESGKYKIVLSGKMMAAMLSTFSSVFSAEAAQLGLSLLKGKEQEKIASDVFTLVDDPFCDEFSVQMPFDAEGVATATREVVSGGVLNTLLYNLKTAKKAGKKSTGNAAKRGYASPVSISPYAFYVKPGEDSQEEVFAKVGDGLYITELNGMHAGADPKTGDFSLASGGFLIKDGKKAGPVKGFTVAGNFFQLLQDVELVGADLKFTTPNGFSAYGSPSVVIRELSVAGK